MDSVPPAGGGLGGGGGGGGPGPGYPESTDSSPRSRGGDSWDEPFPSSAAAAAAGGGGRLRLMCSFGGRIVPRPTDKSLCYLGGETRIVAVDRNASLADVHARLSRSLLSGQPFTLKYQLPNEDLDSLISVSTDEDLDNLVDEYDRVAATSSAGGGSGSSRTSRIRLFLFPAKPESSSSLGSLLDDSSKSENWFVDALNNAISGSFDGIPRGISTDSASVNCLLGLEDDSSQHSRTGVPSSGPAEDQRAAMNQQKLAAAAGAAASGRQHPHDVQSVPDSPMLDKNSSFGSTSSAPSLSNLPPIRVRPDLPQPPQVSVEDHFAQMGISEQQGLPPPIVGYMQQPPQQVPIIPAMAMPVASISPPEAPSRVFSDDERSDHGGGVRMPQPPKQEVPPTADPNNRAMYYNDRSPRSDMTVGTDAASYRTPAPASDAAVAAAAAAQPPPGYVYAQMQAQQQLHQQPQQQLQQQQQPQQHLQPQQQLQQQPQQQLQQQPQQQLQQQPQQQLQQQPQQQLQQQPQQQLQQQPAPPQQQHQPAPQQQYVTAGNQHFIHNPATGTFIPIQSYYHQPVPQAAPQQQQAPAYDPNTGMYYIPMPRPNAPQQYSIPPPGAGAPMPAQTLVDSAPKPAVPIPQQPIPQQYMKPELQQPGLYRTAAPAAPVPGSNTAPGYPGMGYHHVIQSHHHQAQQPAGATMAGNYGFEYGDPRAQVFYSQAGAPPASLPPQYQPMGSPDAGQADMSQNRGS